MAIVKVNHAEREAIVRAARFDLDGTIDEFPDLSFDRELRDRVIGLAELIGTIGTASTEVEEVPVPDRLRPAIDQLHRLMGAAVDDQDKGESDLDYDTAAADVYSLRALDRMRQGMDAWEVTL